MINYASASDLHMLHRRTPTAKIVDNWSQTIDKHHDVIKSLDVLFFAGDIFDRSVPSSHGDIKHIILWLESIGQYCLAHDIKLRFLEGTYTHDLRQMEQWIHLLDNIEGLDVKYFSEITIETIDDTTVLYVPDNASYSIPETFNKVQDMLLTHDLDRVDIAIMHGAFEYQLSIAPDACHNQHDYESIVKHKIHIGDIHTRTQKGKICAQGSFDRLAHGEEEAKGFDVVKDGQLIHIINEGAYKYTTITLEDDLETALVTLAKAVTDMKEGRLRLCLMREHPILPHLRDTSLVPTSIHITLKYPEADVVEIDTTESLKVVRVTANNFMPILTDYLSDDPNQEKITTYLRELTHGI